MKIIKSKNLLMFYIIAGATLCSIKLPTLIADVKGSAIKGILLSSVRILFWPLFVITYIFNKLKQQHDK